MFQLFWFPLDYLKAMKRLIFVLALACVLVMCQAKPVDKGDRPYDVEFLPMPGLDNVNEVQDGFGRLQKKYRFMTDRAKRNDIVNNHMRKLRSLIDRVANFFKMEEIDHARDHRFGNKQHWYVQFGK